MKGSRGAFSEVFTNWVNSISQCCAYFTSCYSDRSQRDSVNTHSVIVQEQPAKAPALLTDDTNDSFKVRSRPSLPAEKPSARKRFTSSLKDFSMKSLLPPRPTRSRRLRISPPTNFRHIDSHAHQFSSEALPSPSPSPPPNPDQLVPFQPLNMPSRLSPMLPYFDPRARVITPPPATRAGDTENDDQASERSRPDSSFHVPRRPVPGSTQTSPRNSLSPPPPEVPPKSRARAYTSPSGRSDDIKERIAQAMLEKERLQEMIDDVIERQSIYLGSRPSTSRSATTQTFAAVDPIPAIPAFPPSAPSFAERLNPAFTQSPTTTPISPASTNFQYSELAPAPLHIVPLHTPPTPPRSRASDHPIQPPLPLVLRPPLRKKKSFSRVSNWLFPSEHQRGLSIDSITNAPRPVRDGDGFYQCVGRRMSGDSEVTAVSWESEDGEGETAPTATTSSCRSPEMRGQGGVEDGLRLDRVATFGDRGGMTAGAAVGSLGKGVVGVAF